MKRKKSIDMTAGRGLEPEDIDRLFPDHVVDYKKRASGERDDEAGPAGDEAAQPLSPELDSTAPTFQDEPWPDEKIEERPELREDVQAPAKIAGRPMIDGMREPQALVRAERKRLEPLPSDKTWRDELRKILHV